MSLKKGKVFIIGSCVSRDIFDAAALQHFELIGYVARSSLASAMEIGAPPIPDVEVEKIGSPFQRRMVVTDLDHALPNILRTTDFDLLLFDAIDERFDVYIDPNGGRCTVSNELLSSNFDPKRRPGRLIRFGSDEHFALWKRGWDALIELLAHRGQLHQLIVNKVYWAQACEDGSDFLPTYSQQRIAEVNAALDRLYGYMTQTLPRQQFLQYDPDAFVGSADHRWGKSPFHFVARTYENALGQLRSRIVERMEEAVPESVRSSHSGVPCGGGTRKLRTVLRSWKTCGRIANWNGAGLGAGACFAGRQRPTVSNLRCLMRTANWQSNPNWSPLPSAARRGATS